MNTLDIKMNWPKKWEGNDTYSLLYADNIVLLVTFQRQNAADALLL